MSSVAIYRFPDRYLVHPICRTTDGLGVASAPYQVLATDASSETVGQAIFAVLEEAHRVVVHPKDWKAHAVPRHAAAGVKSEAAFQRKAQLVTLEWETGQLQVVPHHNGGTRGDAKGFHRINERAIGLAETLPEFIGEAVHRAFTSCAEG